MSTADMFLKLDGVTGETSDAGHKGEIEVISWRWAMGQEMEPHLLTLLDSAHQAEQLGTGRTPQMRELRISKHLDRSSPTLMRLLMRVTPVEKGCLTVRKAGGSQHEYLKIEMDPLWVSGISHETKDAEVIEQVALTFGRVQVTYTPQGTTGGAGGGAVIFRHDTTVSSLKSQQD